MDPKWAFYDRVVLRLWPQLGLKTAGERMNTAALVAYILEKKGRFTYSADLQEKVEMAAKDQREAEAKP